MPPYLHIGSPALHSNLPDDSHCVVSQALQIMDPHETKHTVTSKTNISWFTAQLAKPLLLCQLPGI